MPVTWRHDCLKLPCDVTFGPKEPHTAMELADHDPPSKILLQQMARLVPGFGQLVRGEIAIPISKLSGWHVAMVWTVIGGFKPMKVKNPSIRNFSQVRVTL